MLVLAQKQVEELEVVIQELPTKYGVVILNLFRKFAQENAQKEADSAEVTKAPVATNGVEVEAE